MRGSGRTRTPTAGDPAPSHGRRRKRLVVVAALALTCGAALAVIFWRPAPAQADLRRINGQNVLLVTIDTLRADALGSYGGAAATPALDRLAHEGVRFDFAHAHAVVTLPAHASILTGTYPFQHGIRDNSGFRLPAGTTTLATMLKQAGYRTAAFVASFTLDARFGLNAGFDVYDDRVGDVQGLSDFTMPERPASAVVPLAQQWIADQASGAGRTPGAAAAPWFAWVHVFDPHAPYRPPPPFDAQYAGRPYFGEVAAVDAALAPLLDAVRASGAPTIVIVTGDHGEGLGDHGEEAHGIFAYESTLRIPLIIAEIGGSAARATATASGEVSSVPARHVDILPTLLDAVGQPVPTSLPGRSLLPNDERRTGAPARATYFEAMAGMLNHGWAPLTGVITGRDKFIELPIPERYDLAADAREATNLFSRVPERDRTLASALASFGSALPGARVAEDAEAAARLRALGYVSGSAAAKAKYTDADDPKRLVELDSAVHRALDAFGGGRAQEAAQIYRQVIARRPDMAVAYRHLAFIEWQQGNVTEAISVLRQARAHGVTDARVLAQLGEYLTDAGQMAEGIRLLEPLAQVPDAEPDTLNALAIAYARSGRTADARRVFDRLIGLLPRSSAPLENLGVMALQQGDARSARQYFERAVAISPASSPAHAGIAATAYQQGDRQTAYAEWARAVQLDAGNFDALFSLGINLANDGRFAEARPYLEQFRRTAPPALYAKQLQAAAAALR